MSSSPRTEWQASEALAAALQRSTWAQPARHAARWHQKPRSKRPGLLARLFGSRSPR